MSVVPLRNLCIAVSASFLALMVSGCGGHARAVVPEPIASPAPALTPGSFTNPSAIRPRAPQYRPPAVADADVASAIDARLPVSERQYMRSVLLALRPESRSNVLVYDVTGVPHSNVFDRWRTAPFAQDVVPGGGASGPSGEHITLPSDLPSRYAGTRTPALDQAVQARHAEHERLVRSAAIAMSQVQPAVTCPLAGTRAAAPNACPCPQSVVSGGKRASVVCGGPTPDPTPSPVASTPSTGILPPDPVPDPADRGTESLQNNDCQLGGNNGPYRRVCSDRYGGYAGEVVNVYLPCYAWATNGIQLAARDTGYVYIGAFGAYGEGVDAGLWFRPGANGGEGDYVQFTLYTNSHSQPGGFTYASGAVFTCNQTVTMYWKYVNNGFSYTDPSSNAGLILDITGRTEDGRTVSAIVGGVSGYDTINYPTNYSYVKYKRMTTIAQNSGNNWYAQESFGIDAARNPSVSWSNACLVQGQQPTWWTPCYAWYGGSDNYWPDSGIARVAFFQRYTQESDGIDLYARTGH